MTRRLPPATIALFAIGTVLTVGTLVFWLAGGAHWGWTQTYVVTQMTDPVTGIEYPQKTDKFVPGVEILALGVGAGLACDFLGITLLLRHRIKCR